MANGNSLANVYDGWQGYNTSLVHAVQSLTPEQLAWRPAPGFRSVGELARHISLGRLAWFIRMGAPRSVELAEWISEWDTDSHGNRYVIEEAVAITDRASELVRWLEDTWGMIGETLESWTVPDLSRSYRHTWRGDTYAVSHQWTIWRIMAHDIHHGGELSLMLGMQGIEAFELSDLGGHIVEPPLAGAPGSDS
jgi:uncharacterized damage-inducible protein DinB